MVICLNDKKDNQTVIKLADVVTQEQALVFLHSLDYEDLYSASVCENDGTIIYKIKVGE